MAHIPVGIDLGTSRSLISYIDPIGRPRIIEDLDDNTKLTPSVIMFDKEGDEIIINVGEIAKRSAIARPGDVLRIIKSHMHQKDWTWTDSSGKEWTPTTLSALILKKLKSYAEKTLIENRDLNPGEKLTHAVISVPYYFGTLERERTKEAGKIAGFEVMSIVDEPVAAAISFGLNEETDTSITSLIYDLGGGTFDIAVTRVDSDGQIAIIGTHGHRSLGGANFDQKICEYFKEEFEKAHEINPIEDLRTYQDFMEKAEKAKESLSRDRILTVNVSLSAQGKVLDLVFTREKLVELIQPDLDVSVTLLDETLVNLKVNRELTMECDEYKKAIELKKVEKKAEGKEITDQDERDVLELIKDAARKDLNKIRIEASGNETKKKEWVKIKKEEWGKIDRILLVGGSTKIPRVTTLLKEVSGKDPLTITSPDEAVALGAAILAAWEYKKLFPDAVGIPTVLGRFGESKPKKIITKVSHSLGIKTIGIDGKTSYNTKVIYKDADRPAVGQGYFTTSVDFQSMIKIELLQGESELAEYAQQLGEPVIMTGIPPKPAHQAKIKITLKYDEEDLVHVEAIEEDSGENLSFTVQITSEDTEMEKKHVDQLEVR